jgi:hypothetical protein
VSTEQLLQEIQACFLRLKQAKARARHGYEHFFDELTNTHTRRLQEIEAAYQSAEEEARAVHQQQLANGRLRLSISTPKLRLDCLK